MAGVNEYVTAVQEDPRFTELNFDEKLAVKDHLLQAIRQDSAEYGAANLDVRIEFDKLFMTDLPGMTPDSVSGDSAEAQATREVLADAQNVRQGGQSSLSGWDGFVKTSNNYLSGKLGLGIVDAFTTGDTSEALFGDQRTEADKYQEYVYSKYNPEGLTDYKVGKIVGHIAGFAVDAFATGGLYGSVGKVGLLTKPFAGVATKLLDASVKKFGTKALAYIPMAIGQGSFEAAAYVGERALADKIIGRLDSDAEIDQFISQIPSTFLQGLAFFAIGETLGAGIGQAAKSVKPVFSKSGARLKTFGEVDKQTTEETLAAIKSILSGDGTEHAKLSALRSHGVSEKTTDNIYNTMLDVKAMEDPNLLLKNPKKLNQMAWRILYGMETESVGDGIKVISFNGKDITPQVFTSDADLSKFIASNVEDLENETFEIMAKLASDKKGEISVSVTSSIGTSSAPLNNDLALKYFRPASGVTNRKKLQSFARRISGKDVELVQAEDYFKSAVTVGKNSNQIIIPKNIADGKESARFVDNFFKQLEDLAGDGKKFDYADLKTLMLDSGATRYDRSFIKKLAGVGNYKLYKGGMVDLLKDGEVTGRYTSVKEAGIALHQREFTELELTSSIKKRTGNILQKDQKKYIIKSHKGEVLETFNSIDDVYASPIYRPSIPFNKRPTFISIDMGGPAETVKTFKTGKANQISKALYAYEAEPEAVIHGFTSKNGRISHDPKFNKFKVTLGESGITKEFNELKEADEWLQKGLDTWSEISKDAMDRGFRIQPVKNGYQIYSPNADMQFARTLPEAKTIVGNLDDIKNLKDVFDDITPDDFSLLKGEIGRARDLGNKALKTLKARTIKQKNTPKNAGVHFFHKVFTPMKDRLEGIGDRDAIDQFDRLVGADHSFREEYAKIKQQTNSLFHGKDRKFTVQQLKDMGLIMGVETPKGEWTKLAADSGIELTPAMLDTMQATRDLFDTLGTRFNIDPTTWQKNYFTRMLNRDPADLKNMITGDAMQAAEGIGKVTIDDEFFRFARSEDYVSAIYENNIETVLDTYIRMGMRKQYLGDTLDDLDAFIKKGTLDTETQFLLKEAADKVSGRLYSHERAVELVDKLVQNRKRAEYILSGEGKYARLSSEQRAQRARDAMETDYQHFTNSLVTSALMSFKMKMPIRNVSQVFSVLSPLAEPDYVLAAMKAMDNIEIQQQFYKNLHAKGILKPRDVRPNYGPRLQKFVDHSNSYGMAQFYNSDDFTRMIAARSASERFNDGLELWKTREFTTDQLGEFMKLDYLGEVDQSRFYNFLANRQFEEAETLVQRRWADMTMFEYDLLNKPQGLTSGIGKAFGQYSTYPLSYLQFLKRGWKADKMAFAAKALTASAIVGVFYNDVLNIKGVPILPTETVLFTGGPLITTGASMMTTLNGYADGPTKAKAIINEATRLAIPLYGVGTSVIKGMEEFKEAEYLDGLTRVLGASPSDKSYIANLSEHF